MKKWQFLNLGVLIGCLCLPNTAMAATGEAMWKENNLCVSVSRTDFKETYSVEYLNTDTGIYDCTYEDTVCNSAYLLMINGGFVPNPKILIKENGTVYVPVASLEMLGVDTIIDNINRTITLSHNDTILIFHRDSDRAEINGKNRMVKDNVQEINEEIYVPIRFVAEQFGGKVEYVHDYKKTICDRTQADKLRISLISVEMVNQQDVTACYEPQDKLEEIKTLSLAEHEQISDLLETRKQGFTEENPDYNPLAICYTGETFGRYYVYKIKGFESLPIFVNQYTGEIYSENPWTPIMAIGKGFPDLSKIY